MATPHWIAVDWGTTHCRAWAMADDDTVLDDRRSDQGMGRLAPDGFEPALIALTEGWLRTGVVTPVIACGMVGARQGWVEAPYAAVPCGPLSAPMTRAETRDPRLSVRVIAGLKQMQPPDVMRGEETQIAGFLSLNPRFDGVLCMPGTHTKWVRVSAGEIVSFQTAMTGEVFATLCQHTVLRHSTGGDGWDDEAFLAALTDSMAKPEALAARLFTLRAQGLLHGLSPDAAQARLSGLLIGAELASTRPYWLGQNVAMIGAPGLSARYETALNVQGIDPVHTDGDGMTRAGLIAARAQTPESKI